MSDVVIRAEGLGKKYLIGHASDQERYTLLRDVIGRTAKGMMRSASDMLRGRQLVVGDEVEEFWALKDVSFEIKRGEVIGIVGRNGAGKSTLLKILSRITEPSAGRVEIRGRVASLLEVGTGFHPELSGRENIYLNGAILGMTRVEINRKFDEIVDFAGVEKFLDTPVKRYSSGMYVRLAFAVAAHLEPEILVVDEVLAVGDAEFQKKCLGKMQDVAGHGRTVLFVSHNMSAVARLCAKSILLRSGTVEAFAPTRSVLDAYLNSSADRSAGGALTLPTPRGGTREEARYVRFEIVNRRGEAVVEIPFKEPFLVRFEAEFTVAVRDVNIGFSFIAADGTEIMGSAAHDAGHGADFEPGGYKASIRIDPNVLVPGTYSLRAAIYTRAKLYHYLESAISFSISDHVTGASESAPRRLVGHVHVAYTWDMTVTRRDAESSSVDGLAI